MHNVLVLVIFSHREFFEDLTPSSPEIEAFRKYTLPFEYALDIMGINDVSGHLFSNQIISFHLFSNKNISNRLLTQEILRLLHVKHSQRHNFRKLITCLNSLEDLSGTITEIEHHYFSLIQMKLSEKHKICSHFERNRFLVTFHLSLLDDRVEDEINSSDTLWVKLGLNDLMDKQTCWTNSEISTCTQNKGAISVTLVNFNGSVPLYEVVNVISSKSGCLKLELFLLHPHTQYHFNFSLTQLIVGGRNVTKFNCTDRVVTVITSNLPTSLSTSDYGNQIERNREYIYISYDGELSGGNCDMICEQYRLAIIANDCKETSRITEQITLSTTRTFAEKAFYMCYHAIQLSHVGRDYEAKILLHRGLFMITDGQSNNDLLVRARIHRILAGIYASEGDESQAIKELNKCKVNLETARPSCEKACVLIREAIIRKKHGESKEVVAQLFESSELCILQCTDTKRKILTLPMASVERALFMLNSHSKDFWKEISDSWMNQAKQCLQLYEDCPNIKGKNVYQLKYLVAQSDVYRLSCDLTKAKDYLDEAKRLLDAGNVKMTPVDLAELRIEEKSFFLSKKLQ